MPPWFTLPRTRALLQGPVRRIAVVALAAVVALVSMLVGGMLSFVPTQGAYISEVIWSGAPSSWWYYPEVLVVQPWGILQLPFLPAVATLFVSLGAGAGAVEGAVLARGLVLPLRARDGRSPGAAIATSSAPGIASLATIGACCCSTCASSGGVALVAAASGTTAAQLFTLDWYLPLFQIVVVYVLLVAQERALERADRPARCHPPLDGRFIAGTALRLGLLIAGITWSLAMFVEWGTQPVIGASAGMWYHWIFEHQFLSLLAIAFALFPRGLADGFRTASRKVGRVAVRGAAGVAGVTWGVGAPPALVGAGLGGFVNEAMGALGLPASWGAVTPDAIGPALLAFHWGFQHLLLSGFAIAVAIRPAAAARPLLWTVERDPHARGAAPESAPARHAWEPVRFAMSSPSTEPPATVRDSP